MRVKRATAIFRSTGPMTGSLQHASGGRAFSRRVFGRCRRTRRPTPMTAQDDQRQVVDEAVREGDDHLRQLGQRVLGAEVLEHVLERRDDERSAARP